MADKEILVTRTEKFSFTALVFAFSIFLSKADAQLCQGSLGDPIVNITFGAGSNPGSPLVAATTSYQYVSNDCPNDGFYTVRGNTTACFGSSWHNLTQDHTGDPGGYFMLVNASYQPSAFYLDTVRGLCSGTTYEFAAWILNILLPQACSGTGIRPDLTFTLEKTDGTVLQTYNTGSIPSSSTPTWQQFGFFFSTPVGVSDVVLRIYNNSPGGCGNDLALDDITFRPCGPQVTASIINYSSTNLTVCADTARTFTFNAVVSSGFNNPAYQWQQSVDGGAWTDIPGATTTSFTKNFASIAAPGTYSYRLSAAEAGNLSSAKCRVASQALTIKVAANPATAASANSPICEGNTLSLSASGGVSYQWTGVNNYTGIGSPATVANIQTNQSGKYYVLVINGDGCSHTDSVTVAVNPNPVATTSFASKNICQGNQLQLQSSGGGTYQWLPASGLSATNISNPVASPSDTTNYSVIVTNQFNCTDTASVLINVVEAPHANAGPDRTIIKDNPTQLSASIKGQDVSYSWSPTSDMTNSQSLQPIVTPPVDIDYVLTVTSNEGCGTDEDTVHVFVYLDVFIPNAFTPNGDGKNETWYVPVLNAFTEFEISVYNRAGQMVFHCKDENKPWDGTYKGAMLNNDAYVYMIRIKGIKKLYKGTVMLIR